MRADEIIKRMKKRYELILTWLNYDKRKPWQLLIAVILSAQSSDEQTNKVTRTLFSRYKNLESLAKANLKELERIIRAIGFYKIKSRRVKEAAKFLIKKFKGKIPENMNELLKIPGIGRKSANIILLNIYKKCEGIAVDRHVARVSYRLNLTNSNNPEKIELDLMKKFDKKYWKYINSFFIQHGRKICKPKPFCSSCFLNDICIKKGVKSFS